jgi:hypothetical protein
VLAQLGVTEAVAGCPIVSSMDVVEIARLADGTPVHVDRNAAQADGIVLINRVKPHTTFSGPNESGLAKMIAIGLGKQKGAETCHALGFGHMARLVVEMAQAKLAVLPVLFGVATVENAYDEVARVAAIAAEDIVEAERELLLEAKRNMPRILFDEIDVLIVDQLGKEFSGTGMDPHVTGRASTPYLGKLPLRAASVAVLDVTDRSQGNCNGMGLADVTTRRLFGKIDFDYTYANNLTATVMRSGMIPPVMETDELAIKAAIKVCNAPALDRVRVVRIPNTLQIGDIQISESLVAEASRNPSIEIVGRPHSMTFDAVGNLPDIGRWHRATPVGHAAEADARDKLEEA